MLQAIGAIHLPFQCKNLHTVAALVFKVDTILYSICFILSHIAFKYFSVVQMFYWGIMKQIKDFNLCV